MKIKKTYISRPELTSVLSRSQIILPTEDKNGAVSLLRFDSVSKPLIRQDEQGNDIAVIAEKRFWLQLGYDGEPYFYTALFDESGAFIHLYIDITAGNVCTSPEDMHFDDLFLDIVYFPDGRIMVLDRDELDSATDAGVVSPGERESVLRLAEAKIAELEKQGGNSVLRFMQLFNELKTRL